MELFDAPATGPIATLPATLSAQQTIQRLRIATAAYVTEPTDDPPHTLWQPRILGGEIEVSQSGMDALGIGGRIALGIADVEAWDADGALAALVRYGTADGRRAVVRVAPVRDRTRGDWGSPLGSTRIAFDGIVQRVEHAQHQRARIAITDASERLAVPLQPSRYAGTGGMDGVPDLAGKPRPVCLGQRFNVPAVYLGNVDLGDGALPTYAVHWRAVQGITAVRIRGVLQDAVGVAPVVGEFRPWLSLGVFQLGSSPDGPVTADVLGDAVGGYVSTTAGIVRRLAQSLAPAMQDHELQLGTFALAEADLPGAVGYWRGADDTTAAQAVADIAAGCGAIVSGGRDGTLRIADPLAGGDGQFALSEGHILALEPIPLPAALRPLPRVVAVDWRPNAAPLSDLAGIVDAERAALTAEASTVRATSAVISDRVAQERELRLRGLYAEDGAALARAERWRLFFEAGPRAFRVTTDRYLGQVDVGALGAVAYRAFGLDEGAGVVVMGYSEQLAGRRVTLTVVTSPFVVIPPVTRFGGVPLGVFALDLDSLF